MDHDAKLQLGGSLFHLPLASYEFQQAHVVEGYYINPESTMIPRSRENSWPPPVGPFDLPTLHMHQPLDVPYTEAPFDAHYPVVKSEVFESSPRYSYDSTPSTCSSGPRSPKRASISKSSSRSPHKKPKCFDHGCNGRTFSTLGNYKRHVLEKTRVRQTACPVCHKSFTRKSNRDKHLQEQRCGAQEEFDAIFGN